MANTRFFQTSCSLTQDPSDGHSTENMDKNQSLALRIFLKTDPNSYIKDRFDSKKGTIKERLNARRRLGSLAQIASIRLKNINPASFDELDPAERRAQREELEHLFHLIHADLQLNEFKFESIPQLERCRLLLIKLDNPPCLKKETPAEDLIQRVNDSDKPAKYVALTVLAPWIADAMVNFDTTATEGLKFTIDKANKINAHRLNWVWSGGLDLAIMSMLPRGTGHTQYAGNVLSQFSIGTGYMSFVLYYFRLGLNLSLLAHGTLKGSWIEQYDNEIKFGLEERFRTQWQQRKFAIINDMFWATANMACFRYLIGNGMLGYLGGGLTAVLLLMDIGLTIWGYHELETDHNELILQYEQDQKELSQKIAEISGQIAILNKIRSEDIAASKKIKLEEDLAVLYIHLEGIKRDQKQCEFDWEYTNKELYNNLIYSLFLAVGFGLICCSILFPPLGIVAGNVLIFNFVGAAVSCASTIGIHAKTTSIQIEKSQALIEKETDVAYHTENIAYNQRILSYKVASDILIPAAVFACLVLAPTGIGLPILIPFVATLFAIEYMVGQYNKPQESALPEITLDEHVHNPSQSS